MTDARIAEPLAPRAHPGEKGGLPPGTAVPVLRHPAEPTRVSLLDYGPGHVERRTITDAAELAAYRQRDSVTWVMVEGLADAALIARIGTLFGIHPLVVEDILNTHQRPKLEVYDDHLYLVVRSIALDAEALALDSEQVSIVMLDNMLFVFRERHDDTFAHLAARIDVPGGRFRSRGTDYLLYALIDIVVDGYLTVTAGFEALIEELEERLADDPHPGVLDTVRALRRALIAARSHAASMREVTHACLNCDSPLITAGTHVYLRDVLDHALRVQESLATQRELVTGLVDLYHSALSNRMNEVMKVLTVFAAIFIPLTFIAGIYGMNFEYMPELKWRWGYAAVWVVFVLVAGGLAVYFRRRRWI